MFLDLREFVYSIIELYHSTIILIRLLRKGEENYL